jgi:hypothetical protein
MRKRTKILLTLSALTFLSGVIWFSSGVVKGKNPYTPGSLEDKARKAKDGDEEAVRDLADEVFYRYGRMFPTEVQDKVKEQVVRAELEYKKNKKGGVRETHVVNAVNFLAERFDAPDFVKTDHRQVRVMRARLRPEAPSFIAPDPEGKKGLKKKVGQPLNPEVSPLEATCLMLVMLNQKALNDEFQQSPREFAASVKRKPSWMEKDRGGPTIVVNDPRNIEKQRSVFRAVARGAGNMRTIDAINLADDTLHKLGVKK